MISMQEEHTSEVGRREREFLEDKKSLKNDYEKKILYLKNYKLELEDRVKQLEKEAEGESKEDLREENDKLSREIIKLRENVKEK